MRRRGRRDGSDARAGTLASAAPREHFRAALLALSVPLACALAPSAAGASGGEYTIQSLPAGSYKVQFRPPEGADYLPQYYSGKESSAEANLVSAMPGAITAGVDAALAKGGQIAGRVTAAAGGAPLAGVEVCAAVGCALTNAGGEYTLAGFATGEYTVVFLPPEGSSYVFEFYSAKASEEEADKVKVTAGATSTGIDAALAAGGQIAGRVTDATSKAALGNVAVCIELDEPPFGFFGCPLTNASGEYVASGLPSGKYLVGFHPQEGNYVAQYYNGKASEGEADLVDVTSGAATPNVNAALAGGGEIHGTVTAAATAAPVSANVCAQSGGFGYCASTNASGQYAIEGLPTGEYVVEFSAPPAENYLNQYYSGKQSFGEATKVSVKVAETRTGIDAALQAAGRITGRVTAAGDGAPLANIRVCPTPGFLLQCGVSDASGEYVIAGLSTRSYTVEFEALEGAGNWAFQYYNGKAVEGEADPVEVKAGATAAGIDAAMLAGGEISGRVTAADGGAALGEALVCAREAVGFFQSCATTNSPGSSEARSETTAGGGGAPPGGGTTKALFAPPNDSFTFLRAPRFNARTGNLELFLRLLDPGVLRWKLAFRNSDVGFADALATAAGKCKRGLTRRRGRCVHATVPFGSASRSVAAGDVTIKVHASAKALRALHGGHALHVAGPVSFQSARGGSPVTHPVHALVRLRPKRRPSG
jgi:carboxypeptidase family protein